MQTRSIAAGLELSREARGDFLEWLDIGIKEAKSFTEKKCIIQGSKKYLMLIQSKWIATGFNDGQRGLVEEVFMEYPRFYPETAIHEEEPVEFNLLSAAFKFCIWGKLANRLIKACSNDYCFGGCSAETRWNTRVSGAFRVLQYH